jgi:bifunctional NMN adenylyltransferase/nudix hydrolase
VVQPVGSCFVFFKSLKINFLEKNTPHCATAHLRPDHMAQPSGTAVVVGRYQVASLNEIHQTMLNDLLARHKRVIVFLGSSVAVSDANPIDVPFRFSLFEDLYDDRIQVEEMPDLSDDRIWSQELDRRILELRPEGKVCIFGTREGVVERYSGSHVTEVFEADEEQLPPLLDPDQGWDLDSFRAGILYAHLRRFPTVYATVDVAVLTHDHARVLLARKENETRFRFPGGFTDPSDESFELAALRELYEECGEIIVDDMAYLGSTVIDDWRYRGSSDSVITHLYVCYFIEGKPTASDDIAELRWHDISKVKADTFVPEHRDLWEILSEFLTLEDEENALGDDEE